MAINGHHKHLKDVVDRCKCVKFVLFMGYLQCEFKHNMSSLAHRFPFQLRLAAVWTQSMQRIHRKVWIQAIYLWSKVYIFSPQGLDPSKLSIHAKWVWDFSLGGQVRSLLSKSLHINNVDNWRQALTAGREMLFPDCLDVPNTFLGEFMGSLCWKHMNNAYVDISSY